MGWQTGVTIEYVASESTEKDIHNHYREYLKTYTVMKVVNGIDFGSK